MLWSGGEASPPIPLESYRRPAPVKLKHALLFPGSGSQYVGMGQFLKGFPAAQQVWLEANQALEGFEEWRAGLKLEEREGELGELGRMLIGKLGERQQEKKLQEVVFDGPQVRSLSAFRPIAPKLIWTCSRCSRTSSRGRQTPNRPSSSPPLPSSELSR